MFIKNIRFLEKCILKTNVYTKHLYSRSTLDSQIKGYLKNVKYLGDFHSYNSRKKQT